MKTTIEQLIREIVHDEVRKINSLEKAAQILALETSSDLRKKSAEAMATKQKETAVTEPSEVTVDKTSSPTTSDLIGTQKYAMTQKRQEFARKLQRLGYATKKNQEALNEAMKEFIDPQLHENPNLFLCVKEEAFEALEAKLAETL